MFLAPNKTIGRCEFCKNPIYRIEGYRVFNSKLLHDNCHAPYVVKQRQEERQRR